MRGGGGVACILCWLLILPYSLGQELKLDELPYKSGKQVNHPLTQPDESLAWKSLTNGQLLVSHGQWKGLPMREYTVKIGVLIRML